MASTFDNQTVGNTLTVNSQVTVENAYTSGAAVTIQIDVDPSVKLNLNVSSVTGKVALTGDRDTTFKSLFYRAPQARWKPTSKTKLPSQAQYC